MEQCPTCGRPYGKRKRCYYCQPGRRRTGETRTCLRCGQLFYTERNQLVKVHGAGKFCSNGCKAEAQRGRISNAARPEELIAHTSGYLQVWMPEHPRAHRGRVFQHIVVAEQKLGRPIGPNEHVHHIDENKQNNDPDNLLVLSNEDHQRFHVDHMNQQRHQINGIKKRLAMLEIENEYLRDANTALEVENATLRAQLKSPVIS